MQELASLDKCEPYLLLEVLRTMFYLARERDRDRDKHGFGSGNSPIIAGNSMH